MRRALLASVPLVVGVTILLGGAPAAAGPWINPDGDISEWGIDYANNNWYPLGVPSGAGLAFSVDDDLTHLGSGSGGEWYDIEALYMTLEVEGDTQYLSWCLISSYAGVEAYPYSGQAVGYRNGTAGVAIEYPYRRHPVVALEFNGSQSWDYGILMAPGHDWQWNAGESGWDMTTSHGLQDQYSSSESHDRQPHPADVGGVTATIQDTPQLWDVNDGWRDAHPNEFGGGAPPAQNPTAHPVDFDVRSSSSNVDLSVNGALAAAYLYREAGYGEPSPPSSGVGGAGQVNASYWWQRDNWVWEGWVEFPMSVVDFTSYSEMSFHYALWCGNNDHQGDHIAYGDFDGDDVPELGTWTLLLCTAAFGGWIRRRK